MGCEFFEGEIVGCFYEGGEEYVVGVVVGVDGVWCGEWFWWIFEE